MQPCGKTDRRWSWLQVSLQRLATDADHRDGVRRFEAKQSVSGNSRDGSSSGQPVVIGHDNEVLTIELANTKAADAK